MIFIKVESFDVRLIRSFYSNYLLKFFKKETVKGPIFLPSKKKRFTVLKSPHVNSKSKEHFEIKVHKAVFYFKLNYFNSISFDFLKNINLFFEIPSGIKVSFIKKN